MATDTFNHARTCRSDCVVYALTGCLSSEARLAAGVSRPVRALAYMSGCAAALGIQVCGDLASLVAQVTGTQA